MIQKKEAARAQQNIRVLDEKRQIQLYITTPPIYINDISHTNTHTITNRWPNLRVSYSIYPNLSVQPIRSSKLPCFPLFFFGCVIESHVYFCACVC